jgi:hypothetical protein
VNALGIFVELYRMLHLYLNFSSLKLSHLSAISGGLLVLLNISLGAKGTGGGVSYMGRFYFEYSKGRDQRRRGRYVGKKRKEESRIYFRK